MIRNYRIALMFEAGVMLFKGIVVTVVLYALT